jgi:hypothetical protein
MAYRESLPFSLLRNHFKTFQIILVNAEPNMELVAGASTLRKQFKQFKKCSRTNARIILLRTDSGDAQEAQSGRPRPCSRGT